MTDLDQQIADAAKEWWLHFITPDKGYEGGWKQRNDMVEARKRKLNDLLRRACGSSRNKRPGHSSS
jgi:hypothetical protein